MTLDEQIRILAAAIHSHVCKVSHADQCPWYAEEDAYGEDDKWSGRAHGRFITRAQDLYGLTGLHPLDIAKVLKYI